MRNLYGERYRALILYGSRARGDAVEGSDVDLLLVLAGEVRAGEEIKRISPVKWPLALESGYLLTVLPISERAYRTSEDPFLVNVRREGVIVAR
jgi:predicted nucleotidyltransferase